MSDNRKEKLEEALRIAAAEFLVREATPQSLITVTRATVGEGARTGVVYMTVLPDSQEVAAVSFANRHRAEFNDFFSKRVRGVQPPRIEFVIDRGEKNRQRLDELTDV